MVKNYKFFVMSLVVFSLFLPFQNCAPQFQVADTLEEINQLADPSVLSPPVISFSTNTPEIFNSNQVSFSFQVTMTGSSPLRSVMCQLNNTPAVNCDSLSVTFADLSDGDHTVTIIAETMADTRAELTRVFRKDSTPPIVNVSLMPSVITNQTTAQFQFMTSDSLSGIAQVQCSLNNAAFETCSSPASVAGLTAGTHSYRIRAMDRAGNSSPVYSHTWTVDLTAPTLLLTSTPQALTNSTTASFAFSGNAIVSYECQIDNGAYVPCTSPRVYNNLTSGAHTFRARGTNASQNVSSPVQYVWTVDNVAPTAPVVTASVTAISNTRSASLSFVSTDQTGISFYQCSVNNAAFANCSSPVNLTNLSDGVYSYRFRAHDGAGNVSAISTFSWTVDATAPGLAFTQAPTTSISTTATLAFNVSDAGTGLSTVQCSLNNAAFANCTSPVNLTNLSVQAHNFRVQARDNAGNMTLITHIWSTTAPAPPPNTDEMNLAAGRVLYTNNCASCHNSVDASTKRNRTAASIQGAINNVPAMMALRNLTSTEIDQISRALSDVAPPTIGNNGRAVFACDPMNVPRTPMVKLTNREYINLLNGLLDGFSSTLKTDSQYTTLLSQIPSDILPAGRFTAREQPFLLTDAMALAYFEAAFRAGALLSTNNTGLQNYPNTNSCLATATITQACHQLFVRELASQAFRKSLTTTEANALAATLWDSTLSKETLLQVTFATITQQPDALYKVYDRGTVSPRGSRVLTLTAHELASKVSYFLTGQAPDTTLRNLANNGQILNNATLSQEVDRLLSLPAAQTTIQRMFKEAYGYDRFENLNYTPEFLDGQSTTGLAVGMIQELDHYFVHTVLNQQGTFRDLMTSQVSQVTNPALAQVYGVSASTNVISLPTHRAGFLNRAAFLTRRSGNFTSPIKRGLFVLENIMCDSVGAPPPDAPTTIAPNPNPGQYLTTRQRYAASTEATGSSCIACHSRINHLGYPYEHFDSIGRFRTSERIFTSNTGPHVATLPVDTQSLSPDLRPSMPTVISDSVALGTELGNNDKAMMCFVRAMKNFESKVTPTASDNCQMNESLSVLYGTNGTQGSIRQAIRSLILSNDFRLWSY